MLTTKQAADYRSVAGSVHTQLVDTRLNQGKPTRPVDRYAQRRLETIKQLLQVGQRFARNPDGSLDRVRAATPEKLTLARQLVDLVPKKLPPYDNGGFAMKDWTQRAVSVLDVLATGKGWQDLNLDDVRFIEVELEGFLENLLSLPPEKPERLGGRRRR